MKSWRCCEALVSLALVSKLCVYVDSYQAAGAGRRSPAALGPLDARAHLVELINCLDCDAQLGSPPLTPRIVAAMRRETR